MCAGAKNQVCSIGSHQMERRQSCLVFIGQVKQVRCKASFKIWVREGDFNNFKNGCVGFKLHSFGKCMCRVVNTSNNWTSVCKWGLLY